MLDRHTEIIAHFIGSFDQAVEESILRLQYDEFRAVKALIEDGNPLLQIDVSVRSELILDPYDPGVFYAAPYSIGPLPYPGIMVGLSGSDYPSVDRSLDLHFRFHDFQGQGISYVLRTGPFEVPPPGSWVNIVAQSNWLFDDDLVLQRALDLDPELAASRTMDALDAQFQHLVALTAGLSPLGTELTPPTDDLSVEHFHDTLSAFDEAQDGSANEWVDSAVFRSGSHAPQYSATIPVGGVIVNGAQEDVIPDTLTERLEARSGLEEEPDEDELNDAALAVGDTLDGVISLEEGQLADETSGLGELIQSIAMGNNLLMNEVVLQHASVDAPLIVVGGAAHDLSIISQVNVVSDQDTILTDALSTNTNGPTETFNIAQIEWMENPSIGPTYVGPAEHQGQPAAYAVAELTGDLVYYSTTIQINLVSDDDVVTFETTFHAFDLTTGDNVAANAAVMQGFHSGFDMILVGGDMLSLASIQQVNLLFDDDVVAGDPGTTGALETSGNLLWNEATLGRTGVDQGVDMTASAAEALDAIAAGTFDPTIFNTDQTFDDFYVPRILTVEGSFLTQHHLVQVNMLSDADTLQLFASLLEGLGMNRVDLSTGGNILANIANLQLNGLDSEVMTYDGVYSDAVIYQAGMLDTEGDLFDMDFGEGALGDLASEAVAFLADGLLIDQEQNDHDAGFGGGNDGSGSGTFDTLNTMVA